MKATLRKLLGLTLLVAMTLSVSTMAIAQRKKTSSTPKPTVNIQTFTVKGVTFNMIKVKAGRFLMGDKSEGSRDNEKPQHYVTLTKDYYIGETEVTQELWEAVMDDNPSEFPNPNHPVEMVSWDDCQEFISALNELTQVQFRLPTEAEWEFAARGGVKAQNFKYSGSNNIMEVGWYYANCGVELLDDNDWSFDKLSANKGKTRPVKQKKPNILGIYDMTGNVWEWCQDLYGPYSSEEQTDPKGYSSDKGSTSSETVWIGATLGTDRVKRGGSWYSGGYENRLTYREFNSPSSSGTDQGIRLAL